MAPFDVVVAAADSEGPWARRIRSSLRGLATRLRDSGRDQRHLLAMTLFSDATDAATYPLRREHMLAVVREFFGGAPPPASVVAQAVGGPRGMTLEATVLAAPVAAVSVVRRSCDGIAYTVVSGPGTRQIHCSGISSDPSLDNRDAQSADAFAKMEATLRNEGMTFGHVLRQWSYIEGLLDIRVVGAAAQQGYQAFNDARTVAYRPWAFPAGYPAATGIGQAAGGVVLDFIALEAPSEVRIAPLSNPRQTDAHRYSARMLVGEPLEAVAVKCTPKFERAKLVAAGDREVIFVSGTAAIVGQSSVAPGDVEAQTKTTIDNIAAMVGDRRLSHLRAYVKRNGDIPAVRRICEAEFGPVPAVYVTADICRDELLVELEGALVRRARMPPR